LRRTPAQKDTAAIRARAISNQQAYMKILKPVLFVISLFGLSIANAQSLNFVNKANMPTARAASSAASDGGFEYISNGFSPALNYTSEIEKYDFANDSWSTFSTSIPTISKRYGNAEILSGILYLYNGITPTGLNDKFEIIELGTGNVTVSTSINPNPVHNAGSALIGDYLLSFGGCVSEWEGIYSKKFYKIAPWGEWTQLADMPIALETKGVAVYGNGNNAKLYAFGGYNQTGALRENFETAATTGNLALTDWINVAEAGTKAFQGKTFTNNKYAQITAFTSTVADQNPASIAWLVSPQITLSSTDNTFLSFDTKDGFDNGATLQAYLISNWTGDITTSTKTLLSATISNGHALGFGADFVSSGQISLAGNPESFRIAFKYSGGYSPAAKTTTFQIDNVKVYQEYKSQNVYVYDFTSDTWTTLFDVLPQTVSAHDVVVDDVFSPAAKIYITGDYQNQTFLGVFDTANNVFTAINQTNMIGRRHHKTAIFENKLYLFGGNTTPQTSSTLNSTQSANLETLATTTFNNKKAVAFYPNPATDKITLNSNIETVLLYTFEGKKIDTPIQNNEIDLSHLSNGIYLLQGTNKDGSLFSDKLIKN
jgi:hypothetical protein